MPSICMYFQVHQPYRLRNLSYFTKEPLNSYWDDDLNRQVLCKVAEKCYLPTNDLLLKLIKQHLGRFKVAFSITGTLIEQLKQYCPSVLDSFKALVATGCVELLNETYHHSLSAVFSENIFIEEVKMHHNLILDEFDYAARTFRNTELIYNNQIAEIVAKLGYETILAEGADKVLKHRSPNFLYQTKTTRPIFLLMKNYALSDDIAFRFSNQGWSEYPLTADKYVYWLSQLESQADLINLFMDYETFGEHQWQSTGIFEFLANLPNLVFSKTKFDFCTPHEAGVFYDSKEQLDVLEFYSWADSERDLSAWIGNELQNDALDTVYRLEDLVNKSQDTEARDIWKKLLTSDHFYYMCTKYQADGDVHKYFSPFKNPHDAYINFQRIIKALNLRLVRVCESVG